MNWPPTIQTAIVTEALTALASVHPADRLQTIGWMRVQLDAEQQQAVEEMRTAAHSWEEIGNALGVTRTAAWQRYGR